VERESARRSLEQHGDARLAAEAAERAASLDPTEAGSWILLASARLRLGEARQARAAFLRCVDEATIGPVGECRAMVR
jgi:Flp pilus assembly protein TadD